jgi:hypothetical protein
MGSIVEMGEVTSRLCALNAAIGDLVDLPWGDVSLGIAEAVAEGVESAQRTLSIVSCSAVNRLRQDEALRRGRRLRDKLANELHISATEAGSRIATATDLIGDESFLPETAAAARHGLIGAEHIHIIRDTVAKLPDSVSESDRAHFDVELAALAIAERPEVLRREAALLLADYDATRDDPITRERRRAARREFVLGPQDADGMRRGRFCLDPEGGAYLEILLAKLARPGMCNDEDPIPVVDGEPDVEAAATDTRTTNQRNHDAVKAAMRALLASGELGQHRGLPVTAIVTMTLDDLEAGSGLALTGGGSIVPMEVAIRMAAHAHHYLYIYDEKSGRPLFLGRSKRLASADQRIVLHATDGGCTMPGCDQPAYHCEVGHLHDWADGGGTDIDWLTLTCQDANLSTGPSYEQWQARRRYDNETLGQTLWYPPKSVDPSRQPRANRFHRRARRPPLEPDVA